LIQIKHRYNGSVLFEVEAGSLKAALEIAVKQKVDLSYSDLSYSNLRGSNLSYSNLRGSDLRDSDLSYSNLSYSNLSYSDLSYSDLRGSDLSDSNLRGSNLSYSNLSYSNLRGSNLRGSDLRGSNLSYSNLRGSKNAPLILFGLAYQIYINETHIRIGCERHTITDWDSFDAARIQSMDSGATEFWTAHKTAIMALAHHHAATIEKQKETEQ